LEHPVGRLIAETTTADDFVVGDFDFDDVEGLVLLSEREGLIVICIAFGISTTYCILSRKTKNL